MYLAPDIRTELQSIRSKFTGTMSYEKIIKILTPSLKKFRAKPLLLLVNMDKNYRTISGLFDRDVKRLPITIEIVCSANGKSLRHSKKMWDEFLFDIYEVMLHEHLHLCQTSFRDSSNMDIYLELDDDTELSKKQSYYAELDEIDAYGLSIALEILWKYPKRNPFEVLGNLKNEGIVTYDSYHEEFAGTKWDSIRQQLLKKIYRWLSDVVENNWGYEKTSLTVAKK